MIDHDHPVVEAFLAGTGWRHLDASTRTEAAYRFVRDEIAHSVDACDDRITLRASEVLIQRVGLCYAKSHLLAALLRGIAVPAGFGYQRLLLTEDSNDGFVLHGLNAVWLDRWIWLDARGNRPGIHAEFSLSEARLAFAVRPKLGEREVGEVLSDPLPAVVEALESAPDMATLFARGFPA